MRVDVLLQMLVLNHYSKKLEAPLLSGFSECIFLASREAHVKRIILSYLAHASTGLSWCIYIRVGDTWLPTFFIFGVRDKCRGQRMFVIFLVLDLHHCIRHVQNQKYIEDIV